MVVVERADNNSALLRLPLQTTTSNSNSNLELLQLKICPHLYLIIVFRYMCKNV